MYNKTTGKIINAGGVPLRVPNDITDSKKDFYISYNNRDIGIYGDVTTALVLQTTEYTKFLILNGDHRQQYNEIISNGGNYEECLLYFRDNESLKSKLSENWDEKTTFINGKFITVKDDRYVKKINKND